jgi:hypothetical protein
LPTALTASKRRRAAATNQTKRRKNPSAASAIKGRLHETAVHFGGVGLAPSRPDGGRGPFVGPVWVFLGSPPIGSETKVFRYWIPLDFLGFSRSNLDLSKGYARFSRDDFSSRFCRRKTAVETAAPRCGMRKGWIVHEPSLTWFLIFCKELPSFLRTAAIQKQIPPWRVALGSIERQDSVPDLAAGGYIHSPTFAACST